MVDGSTLTELHQIGEKGVIEKKKYRGNCSTHPNLHPFAQEETHTRVLAGEKT